VLSLAAAGLCASVCCCWGCGRCRRPGSATSYQWQTPVSEDDDSRSAGKATAKGRFDYRPDIDGLRAVAVSAVIAYHLDHALLPGGFVGVDIFFVISGVP